MQKVFQSRLLTSAPRLPGADGSAALRGRGGAGHHQSRVPAPSSRSPTWRGCSTCSTQSTRRSWKPRPGGWPWPRRSTCWVQLRAFRSWSYLAYCTDPSAPTCPSAGRRRRSGGGAGGADGAEGPAAGVSFRHYAREVVDPHRGSGAGPRRSDPCHHRQPVEPAGQACRPVVRGAGRGVSTSRGSARRPDVPGQALVVCMAMRWPPTARHRRKPPPWPARCWPRVQR